MNRVSTAYAFQSSATDFLRAQGKQVEANRHISQGKRASDMKGFGRQSEILIAARTVKSRAESFVDMHKLLTGKLQAQDQALVQVAEKANESRQAVLSAIASGRADTLMSSLNTFYEQSVDALNFRHSGKYLFSGSETDVEPVAAKSLAALENGTTSAAFKNGTTKTENWLDDTSRITTGFLASEVGTELFEVLKSIQTYHETVAPLTGVLTTDQETFLKGKLGALQSAHEGLLGKVAQNGTIQDRLDSATLAQAERAGSLKTFIAEIAEVDLAEAYSRLQQAELAVQASASALKSMKESSLLNFLPV